MRVGIYCDNELLANAMVAADGMLESVQPVDGKGLSYGRWLQITVEDGKHLGQTITALVMGEDDGSVTLKEPMPFK